MLVYVYDGSFEGLLSAVFEAYIRKEDPDALAGKDGLQQDLLAEYVHIGTDKAKSDRVYASIRQNISQEALENVYHVFLSEEPDAGTLIYRYLRLGWRMGSRVDLHLADDTVFKIHEIAKRVGFEAHRFLGFVRFRQLAGNVYYAPLKPDHNIVELLAPHFAERFQDQKWIIHDTRREVAVIYHDNSWFMTEFHPTDLPAPTGEEEKTAALWKEFFNTLAIQSRANPKLQRQLMPKRYWEHLPEKW